jgi:hypothetical protein
MAKNEKDKLIASLEKLGLSNYEARAYLAAVSHPPLTGYKLSKLSGVPRSRIYETIEKLIARGMVVFQSSEKTLLTAVKSDIFLDKKDKENRENIDYLRDTLPRLSAGDDTGVWTINGREQVMKTVYDLIAGARKYVYLSLFADDLLEIKDTILVLRQKEVPVWGIFCGKLDLNLENFYAHLGTSCSTCNEICICADGEQSLIGCTRPADSAAAALTQNKGFINITEQYIKHEIFINRQFAHQDKETIKSYIENYEKTMSQLP